MKIAFHFEDGNSQVILIPEDKRDEMQLNFVTNGRPVVQIKPNVNNALTLEFTVLNTEKKLGE